jgi:serine/threonine protein kinase
MLFIVMAYCEGGDLDALIKSTKKSRQTLPEEKILKWSTQIGLAIHFLHENGIVHRYVCYTFVHIHINIYVYIFI